MDTRLPAHLEVNALIRAAQALGGFGMVLSKGEREAGTILVVIVDNQGAGTVLDRMPQLDGTRRWCEVKSQAFDNLNEIQPYLDRRVQQDPDMWIVELTVADRERCIRETLSAA
ncbi:MAG: DUF1491 family protein [Novosphingobium sp.]